MTGVKADTLLRVENLNAWYGQAHILFDVGFEIGRGEVDLHVHQQKSGARRGYPIPQLHARAFKSGRISRPITAMPSA